MKYLYSLVSVITLVFTLGLYDIASAEEVNVNFINGKISSVASLAPSSVTTTTPSSAEVVYGDFELKDLGDSYEIVEYKGTATTISIPAKVDDKVISKIGNNAFRNKGIESLNIISGVVQIGDYAFEGNKLIRVTLPISVTSIGNYAFANNFIETLNTVNQTMTAGEGVYMNNRLTSIEVPFSLTDVPKYMYKDNKITKVTFAGNPSSIGESAFESNYIENITLPKSVSKIGYRAFRGNLMKSVYISDSVTDLGDYAYSDNPVKTITAPKRLTAKVGQYANISSLDYLNLYENGKDPGFDTKAMSGDTKAEYLLQLGISSGILSLKKPTLFTTNLGNITLGTAKQTIGLKFTDNLEVVDTRGNGEGWHLTLSATPFTEVAKAGGKMPNGGWYKLPKGTISFSGFKSIYTRNSDGTKGGIPTGVSFSKENVIIDDGAVIVAKANKDSGYGINVFEFNETSLQIIIDPNTIRVDNENYKNQATPYTSIVTWTLVTGPGTNTP